MRGGKHGNPRRGEGNAGTRGVTWKRFSSESLRPFSFRRVASFSPGKVAARHSANSPTEYQRVIKRDDRDTPVRRGGWYEREREAGKGLRVGKDPVVSGSLKSDYDVPIIISRGDTPF